MGPVSHLNGPLLQGELLGQTSFQQRTTLLGPAVGGKTGGGTDTPPFNEPPLAVPAVTSRWGTPLSQAALRHPYAPEPSSPGLIALFSAGV